MMIPKENKGLKNIIKKKDEIKREKGTSIREHKKSIKSLQK